VSVGIKTRTRAIAATCLVSLLPIGVGGTTESSDALGGAAPNRSVSILFFSVRSYSNSTAKSVTCAKGLYFGVPPNRGGDRGFCPWVRGRFFLERMAGRLKPLDVDRQTKPGKFGDGDELYSIVTDQTSKSWSYRYCKGKERWHGSGSLEDMSLNDARLARDAAIKITHEVQRTDPGQHSGDRLLLDPFHAGGPSRYERQATMARTTSAPRSPEYAAKINPTPTTSAIALSVIIFKSPR